MDIAATTRTRDAGHQKLICAIDTLTAKDKQLVGQMTGWDMDAEPSGPNPPLSEGERKFIGLLNLERGSGALTEELTSDYITNIIRMQQQDPSGSLMVPFDVLQKALSILRQDAGGIYA